VEVGLHLLVLGLFEELIFERLVYAVVLEGGASCGACSVFALVDARLVEEGTSAVALELERRCLGTCPCTCGTCSRVACRPTLGGSCEGAVPLQCWAGSWGVPMPICRVDVEKPPDVVLSVVVHGRAGSVAGAVAACCCLACAGLGRSSHKSACAWCGRVSCAGQGSPVVCTACSAAPFAVASLTAALDDVTYVIGFEESVVISFVKVFRSLSDSECSCVCSELCDKATVRVDDVILV